MAVIAARSIAGVATLFACLSLTAPISYARAQDGSSSPSSQVDADESAVDPRRDERARELFAQGDEAYEAGRYEVAIMLWREAYAVSARPLLLYNLANAYERLGQLDEAAASLEGYLPDADPGERAAIRSRITLLRQRIEEEETSEAPATPETPAPVPSTPPPARTPPPDTSPPLAPIALFSGAGLALAAGVVMAALASDASGRASPFCRTVEDALYCTPAARGALDDASAFALTADLSFGLALALAAAATVAVVIDASADSEVALALAPSSIQARWRF